MTKKNHQTTNVDNKNNNKVENWLNNKVVPILKIVAANKYLRSLMEGFYVTLPIIVFSSIIGIIMWVPPAIKGDMAWYPLIVRQVLNRLYVLTMGLVSLWFVMGISTALASKLNAELPAGRKMNIMMVAFASASSLFMMSVIGTFALNSDGLATENFANIFIANLGAQGMLTSIIVGLTLPWIFYVPVRYNWTIRLPKAVPQGVSQSFADIIPFGLSVMVYWGFGYIFIGTLNVSFTDALFQAIKPIFSGLDSYGFLASIALLTAMIWFIGVHGPSVTRPFLTPFMYSNLADNQAILAQGGHPHWALTYEFSYDFTSTLGGTGATFVIPFIFIVFAKSKQLKAVGIASYIPIWFQVNEPALFGAPMILNPVYLIPFWILPVINVLIYKFFIDVLGMNAAIADVPWSMPAIVGLLIGSAFDPLTILLWIIMVTIDFFFYLPFVLIHDKMMMADEVKTAEEKGIPRPLHYAIGTRLWYGIGQKIHHNPEQRKHYATLGAEITADIKIEKTEKSKFKKVEKARMMQEKLDHKNKTKPSHQVAQQLEKDQKIHVLVVCYGAGSSAMFAATAQKAMNAKGMKNFVIDSAAYGAHLEKMKAANIVILSPQVKMYIDDFEKAITPGTKIVITNGKTYVECTNDQQKAYEVVMDAAKDLI
ncbi:PTS transporter subunit EIIC [Williamsoniiplasma lucivorax]|uniref:PTS system lactose-specific EIICB component n=1 Tax=Williamsoniiplasma lucivorax TaxID=209274 RepID=A0A2S5RF26_9MOLU|nr:PTS transporter subunit EIIC [Williamsoniiplasma lucivorax]PPE05735.1 PTS system, cellobiose-specific IIC component [Williamsoniiplasma lucivorax]